VGAAEAANDGYSRLPLLPQKEPGTPYISTMEPRKLRVGAPISPDEFDMLTDEQLIRLLPRAYREFFPGKDFCADGHFYLHDGNAWCFYKGGFLDD
jgi:hypothetical protein